MVAQSQLSTMRISVNSAAKNVRLSTEQILLRLAQTVKMKGNRHPVYQLGESERERQNDDSYHEDHERV